MNGFGAWLRQLRDKFSAGMRRFMAGRYGNDKLNMAILTVSLIICVISLFIPFYLIDCILVLICYSLMFWAIFRALSRNTYKRYQENRRYLMFVDRMKDKEHRYFECPKCHQPVRVPRHKGKIAITCPKCKEKFIRKT